MTEDPGRYMTAPLPEVKPFMQDQPYLFTVPEAARHLGLKRSKVYDMAKRGEIPTIRFGRYVRIPRQALEKWVDAQIRRKGGKLIVKERFIQPGI